MNKTAGASPRPTRKSKVRLTAVRDNRLKGKLMKKIIASKKWLVTYLVILLFLCCFSVTGIALILYAVGSNRTDILAIGIVTLGYMLPVTGIILFYLNRRACLIWIEDGCLKRKGLFFGFHASITPEEVFSVDVTYDDKYILVIAGRVIASHCFDDKSVKLDNNDRNMDLVRSFWKGEIFIP